jgi:hypothetical protein
MFLGHYGVAYALKRAEPRVSLGTLFLSVVLVDTVWGVFLLTGWELARVFPGFTRVTPLEFTSYPLTHSLVGAIAWGLLGAAIMYSWPTRDTSRHHWLKALVVGVAIASHWFLDLIVHIPDLPLVGDDSTKVGLGLWRSLPATLAVELVPFAAGFLLYVQLRFASGRARKGRIAFLAGLLVVLYLASLFGPAPASMTTVAVVDILGTVTLAILAAWSDRSTPKARA